MANLRDLPLYSFERNEKRKVDCIFCKIINKSLEANIVYENDNLSAFYDTSPSAPVHILVVPKKHITSVNQMKEEDEGLFGELIYSAKIIAQEQKIDDGYKLLFNVGRKAGQMVDHVHLHLQGGWK